LILFSGLSGGHALPYGLPKGTGVVLLPMPSYFVHLVGEILDLDTLPAN
jgi:hypothetical protein